MVYYILVWVGFKVGKLDESIEKIEVLEKWGFLRDIIIFIVLIMMIFYLIVVIVVGLIYVVIILDGILLMLFVFMVGFKFVVGVIIVYSGVRMIFGDFILVF